MGHHPRELRFVIGRLNRAAIHKHVSSRQGKRVDGPIVDTMEFPWVGRAMRIEMRHKLHPELSQVSIYLGGVTYGQLSDCLGRVFFPHGNVLLHRKQVPSWFQLSPLRKGGRNANRRSNEENCYCTHGNLGADWNFLE